MKLVFAGCFTGQTDLYRFREHIRPYYPESEIIDFVQQYYLLKIHVASGKVHLDKDVGFSIDCYMHRSSCFVFVIELDDKFEEAIKDPSTFIFKFFPFIINNQEMKNSFYFIITDLPTRMLRLENHKDLTAINSISDIKQEVIDNSGIDFLLYGKNNIYFAFIGRLSPIIIEEIPSNTNKLEKIELDEETIFIKDRYIFYTTSEPIHKQIIFYTLITNFYGFQGDVIGVCQDDMKKDIVGLKQGLKIKGSVGWEWEIQEFDIKRLNFLEYLAYYRFFDDAYSRVYIPFQLKAKFDVNDIKTVNITPNLDAVQFTITEIDRIVEEKQTALATRRTKNLEYLLTILGGLGGVAAIFAALFTGGLKPETRIIAILLLFFIPLTAVVFEYLVRKGIAKRSREAYLNTKIANLTKQKQSLEQWLRAMQTQGKTIPETKAEFSQTMTTQIKQMEKEIENLSNAKQKG